MMKEAASTNCHVSRTRPELKDEFTHSCIVRFDPYSSTSPAKRVSRRQPCRKTTRESLTFNICLSKEPILARPLYSSKAVDSASNRWSPPLPFSNACSRRPIRHVPPPLVSKSSPRDVRIRDSDNETPEIEERNATCAPIFVTVMRAIPVTIPETPTRKILGCSRLGALKIASMPRWPEFVRMFLPLPGENGLNKSYITVFRTEFQRS